MECSNCGMASCGMFKMWSAKLWCLKARFKGKNNTHVLFFFILSFSWFFLFWFIRGFISVVLFFSCVFFFPIFACSLFVLTPFRQEDDGCGVIFLPVVTLVKNRKWNPTIYECHHFHLLFHPLLDTKMVAHRHCFPSFFLLGIVPLKNKWWS